MSGRSGGHRRTIVVSGMIAGVPYQGGATWAVLQYVLGLRLLGHDVVFVEPVERSALCPEGATLDGSVNAAYFRDVVSSFGAHGTFALLLAGTERTVGVSYAALQKLCAGADVLFNISGMLRDRRLTAGIPVRIYLDLDPGFNQFWAMEGIDMNFGDHTHFVTVGQAIGQADCPVPTCGLPWIPTFQPVALRYWPVAQHITYDALTTVGHWRSYGSITYEGVFYGQKAHAFRRFVTLPARTQETLALALAIHPGETEDVTALVQNGWRLLDPSQLTLSPSTYQRFIQESKGEVGIAKSGYVDARCGWFSDRSVCYLASGRPVIAAETGFSQFLPVGEGLLPFATDDEFVARVDTLNDDYPRHARAARGIAEEYFDSAKVLTRVLERTGAA